MTGVPLKIAVLGTRHVHAEGFAKAAMSAGATIIGAAESDEAAAQDWSTDIAPLMDRKQLLDRCDAVIVAGTNRERCKATIEAIERGLPTLSEKPVAISAFELNRLDGHKQQALAMVAFPIRFSASVQRAREAVQSGAIGTPIAGRGTNHGQYPGGWFGSKREAGGGALTDHIVHVSDALCHILQSPARRVYAQSAQAIYPDLDVEDCGVATIDFDNGFFASIDASWSRPRSFPAWGDVWIEIVGSEGRIIIDPMAQHIEHFDDKLGRMRHRHYGDDDMTSKMLSAFVDFAREPVDSPVPVAAGIHASDIVQACYTSAESGTRVDVTERATFQ